MHAHNTTGGVLMQKFANHGDVGALDAPGGPDMPPGFANHGDVGVLDAPGGPDMPPGFGHRLSASTSRDKGKGPTRLPNLDEAFGDRYMSKHKIVHTLFLAQIAKQRGILQFAC